jgi:predicted small secreted protein
MYVSGVRKLQEQNMKSFISLVLLAAVLSGCNTVQGIGKDVEKGGEAIQRAVKK